MTSENPPTLNEPREEITDEIKGRPTAHTITPDQLAELHADLDRYEEIQGDMNEQAISDARAIAYFEMQLGRLRDQLAILAGNRPTPEQLRGEHATDTAMARRIHQARPGLPAHHILATLEVLRAVQELEPTEAAPANPDLTVQQSDALWDAVAIPGPEQPTFVKQHERVCEVVAEMLHQATAPREEITQPDEPGPAATKATQTQ